MDDLYIIVWNPLVHSLHGAWRVFGGPYWPPDLGGQMYRPLPLATFAVDWSVARGHPALFHAMNLLWHTGAAIAVTALARRLGDWTAALVAERVFAAHLPDRSAAVHLHLRPPSKWPGFAVPAALSAGPLPTNPRVG